MDRIENNPAPGAAIGKIIVCHNHPYGTFTLHVDSEGEYNGHRLVEGVVLSGTETSRLFQHSRTRDISGERCTIYGLKDWELERGECTRVAM